MREKRTIPLGIKNSRPDLYGYPSPMMIPGNENGIAVPCAPFEIDTDKRWFQMETFEEAYFWRNEYRKEQVAKDMESRCIIPGNYIVPPKGTRGNFKIAEKKRGIRYEPKKCTYQDCNYCPYLWDERFPDRQVDYKRTGSPISLDFKYDPTDQDEGKHDVEDTSTPTPSEQYESKEKYEALLELLNEQDETDKRIIEVLLDNDGISDASIHKILTDIPERTIRYRHTRLINLIKEFLKNYE